MASKRESKAATAAAGSGSSPAAPASSSKARRESVKTTPLSALASKATDEILGPAPVPRPQRLLAPQLLLKYVKNGKAIPHHRYFYVDYERRLLCWSEENPATRKSLRGERSIPLDDISEIRPGQQTEGFMHFPHEEAADRSFSVIYSAQFHSLDLIADTPEIRDLWVDELETLNSEQEEGDKLRRTVEVAFQLADKNQSKSLDMKEVYNLLLTLNVMIPRKSLKQMVAKSDADNNGTLDFEEFFKFYQGLRFRTEFKDLFEKLQGTVPSWSKLSPDALREFLRKEQGMTFRESSSDTTLPSYETIIRRYLNSSLQVTLDGFSRFMDSTYNSVYNYHMRQVYQDMSRPMTDYFINSSHNTYLLGDQLRSKSSVEAYIRALQKGCRCVELDCWDGPNNEPVIYHGHTLTSKILFKDVIHAIQKYAFVTSPYPVVLSLEVHCDLEQQRKMAEHMRNIFGEMLLLKRVDPKETVMPSPDALRRKILIKAKSIREHMEGEEDDEDEFDDPDSLASKSGSFRSSTSSASIVSKRSSTVPGPSTKKPKAKSKTVAEELSRLVVYFASAHFKDFEHARANVGFENVVSLGEKKSVVLVTRSPVETIEFTQRVMTRIYPAGSRVDSSNYDPFPHWQAGCQVVALNYQTLDLPMHINLARFSENGRAGYLLKPAHLRNKMSTPTMPLRVVVQVISGRSLPKVDNRVLDPVVEVQLIGPEPDNKLDRTAAVKGNGFNPSWSHTTALDVFHPDYSFVRFTVRDNEGDRKAEPVAQCWVPVLALGVGHRTVPLIDDLLNNLHHSSLFVHVAIAAFVPPSAGPVAPALPSPATPTVPVLDVAIPAGSVAARTSTFENAAADK